jgi:hypothetical protein
MPVLKCFKGVSRNRSTSENATISSNFALISLFLHSQNRAAQVNVFAPRQFRMKAGADFEKASDAPLESQQIQAVGR